MKHLYSLSILILLILCLLFSSTMKSQTPFQSWLTATAAGVIMDPVTVNWGLDPLATNGIDSSLGELELPPFPPSDVFDLRFVNPPGWNLFGEGLSFDLRPAVGGEQRDTFCIYIQSPEENIVLNWASDLAPLCGTLRLINHPSFAYDPDDDTRPLVNVNMLTQPNFTLTGYAADGGYKILMIRTHLKPEIVVSPLSHNFGLVDVGSPEPYGFNITNDGGEELIISSIVSPDPAFELSATSMVVAPFSNDVLTVTFNPTVAGEVFGDVQLNHNGDVGLTLIPVSGTGRIADEDTSKYRSFTHAELVTEDAVKPGKLQKYVKRKADKVEVKLLLTVKGDGYNILHIEWGSAPLPAFPHVVKLNDVELTAGVDYTLDFAFDGKAKKFNYTFTGGLADGDQIYIHMHAAKGKQMKAKYWWLVNLVTKPVEKLPLDPTAPQFIMNDPRLPFPSYTNVVADIFPDVKAGKSGLLIGVERMDSVKVYGWMKNFSYKDLQKTLRGKTPGAAGLHKGDPRHFDFYTGTVKKVLKLNKALPPEKHDNVLMANLLALRFNIYASANSHTPAGFGELEYYEPDNDLDGMSLLEISALGNEKMTYHDPEFDYANLNTVVAAVNGAFSGALDTVRFWDKLVLTPVKSLSEVPFLKQGSGGSGGSIISNPPSAPMVMPEEFVLNQNYPNPFNPTTTIEFNLPEDAMVTLKVYNMLGQEVATLIDKEELYEGWESVNFDATGLSSGVYIYRVIAVGTESGETFQMIKKMVLMK